MEPYKTSQFWQHVTARLLVRVLLGEPIISIFTIPHPIKASSCSGVLLYWRRVISPRFIGESERGVSPSFIFLPLSFQGEGDTGGEVQISCACAIIFLGLKLCGID